MIILGLDLSLSSTGHVKIKDGKILDKKLIRSKPPKIKTPQAEFNRIMEIVGAIDMEGVDFVSIEGPAMMSHRTTSLVQLSGLNYMVRTRAWLSGVPFIIIPPKSLKKFIARNGNAGKDEMMDATQRYYNERFTDNNLCDAFSLAVCAEAMIVSDYSNLDEKQIEVVKKLKSQFYEK